MTEGGRQRAMIGHAHPQRRTRPIMKETPTIVSTGCPGGLDGGGLSGGVGGSGGGGEGARKALTSISGGAMASTATPRALESDVVEKPARWETVASPASLLCV